MSDDHSNTIVCSFCEKTSLQVRKIISAPRDVFICDGCVRTCAELIDKELAAEEQQVEEEGIDDELPTPTEINAILDQYVIGQDKAKRSLSVAVYNHYKRLRSNVVDDEVELQKSNILLIGPTGCGKTFLAETLARLLKVPFAIADATTLTEAGYVGEDVENIIQKLLQKCDHDPERAREGIIYIDEIDKISRKSDHPSITRDVSGEGVQQALLKLIEGTQASIPPAGGRKHPQQEFIQIDTADILFIVGGAFSGLEKVIQQRSSKGGIGFTAEVSSVDDERRIGEVLEEVEPEDLIKYGLIPEFVGRLPIVATLSELDIKAMIKILTEPKNSLVKQYETLFKMDGVELVIDSSGLEAIAAKALERKTGARGLRSIMEETLLDTMFEVPSERDNGLSSIVIDADVVNRNTEPKRVYENRRLGTDDN